MRKVTTSALIASASLAAAGSAYHYLLRPWHLRWGATDEEVQEHLPGDELIPNAGSIATHGITIAAPTEAVWPWFAQLGQHRGGFYSYAMLENLLGCQMRNAARIVPEWQDVKVGDKVWLHPEAPPMVVVVADPARALVLAATTPPGSEPTPDSMYATWGFYLKPINERTIRLLARVRSDTSRGVLGGERRLIDRLSGYVFWEPVHFLMERKMLLTVKSRAEAAARRDEPNTSVAPPPAPVST